MRVVHMTLLLTGLLVFPPVPKAEMFVTGGPVDSVFVGDHLQDGVGFQNSREIRAGAPALEQPSRVQVYTGTELGGDAVFSRLAVCDEADDGIVLMPIDSEGNADDQNWYKLLHLGAAKCSEFVIHRGHYFLVGEDPSTIEVFPYAGYVDIPGPSRLLRDGLGLAQLSLKADGQYLYGLTSWPDLIRWDLENESSEFQESVSAPWIDCPEPWSALEVHAGLAYVAAGQGPAGAVICVIDVESGVHIRLLSHPDIQAPKELSISGEELFIVDESGIYTFDIGAGGEVPPKRVISTADVQHIWVTQQSGPVEPTFALSLEEPVDGTVHSGVGNLRGWAVADDGITKVDIFVDGQLFQSAPYGGVRADVGGAFPDVVGSGESGFSLAYNYGDLEPGVHTILARAETSTGGVLESSSTFTTTRPGQAFIPGVDAVDLSSASCSINQGRSVRIEDITIDGGGPWDAFLEWRPAAQGFVVKDYIFNADGI